MKSEKQNKLRTTPDYCFSEDKAQPTTRMKTRNLIPRTCICLPWLRIAKLEHSRFDLTSDYRHDDTVGHMTCISSNTAWPAQSLLKRQPYL